MIVEGLSKLFTIADFTTNSLPHLLDLLSDESKKFPHEAKKMRDHIRTDVQILATALSNNASVIYSSDSHFPTLAKDKIKVINHTKQPLPPIQKSLDFGPENEQ